MTHGRPSPSRSRNGCLRIAAQPLPGLRFVGAVEGAAQAAVDQHEPVEVLVAGAPGEVPRGVVATATRRASDRRGPRACPPARAAHDAPESSSSTRQPPVGGEAELRAAGRLVVRRDRRVGDPARRSSRTSPDRRRGRRARWRTSRVLELAANGGRPPTPARPGTRATISRAVSVKSPRAAVRPRHEDEHGLALAGPNRVTSTLVVAGRPRAPGQRTVIWPPRAARRGAARASSTGPGGSRRAHGAREPTMEAWPS